MRSKLFDDVVQSFARLPLAGEEGGTGEYFFRAIYGLPFSLHIGAMEGALARALAGVERRWPSEAAPRQLVTDLRGWLARYGRRWVPAFLTQDDAAEGDAGFAGAALAALNGVNYADDAGVLAVSTACCVRRAIHSIAVSVWEQNDPEAAKAAPEDWYAGRFEKERWFFDNPEVAEITRAEWTRVVDNLLAAGAAEVPLPDANGVAAREHALERWKANSGIFISPSPNTHELLRLEQQRTMPKSVQDVAESPVSALQRRAAASMPTVSGIVARIQELKRQPGRSAEVAQLADELKKRCFRFAAKRMIANDFLYSLEDGVHFVPARAAIHELDHMDAESISSCASALRLAVESAFAKVGAPRLVSYSVAVPGTPEHLWLKAAQAGHPEPILRAWGHAIAAGKIEAPEAPIEAPQASVGPTTLPEVGPEPTSLLGELAAPLVAAIGTSVAIKLYARPTASRWASEMNPVTGRPYTNEDEFDAVQAMSEQERAAARRRLLASEAGGQ